MGQDLSTPKIDPIPLANEEGISGYRMEALIKIPDGKIAFERRRLEEILFPLHKADFSHGNLTRSNIMEDRSGKLVLIDLGFSGRIGDQVPTDFPSWAYQDDCF